MLHRVSVVGFMRNTARLVLCCSYVARQAGRVAKSDRVQAVGRPCADRVLTMGRPCAARQAGKVAKADRGMAKEKIELRLEMGEDGWSSDPCVQCLPNVHPAACPTACVCCVGGRITGLVRSTPSAPHAPRQPSVG